MLVFLLHLFLFAFLAMGATLFGVLGISAGTSALGAVNDTSISRNVFLADVVTFCIATFICFIFVGLAMYFSP